MIKLTSTIEVEKHKGQIPVIAALRMKQLEGDDGLYHPDAQGWLVVITEQDDVENDFPELGDRGLLSGTEDWPLFEYVEKIPEAEGYVFEAVIHCNNERVQVYLVPDTIWLDKRLREILERMSINSTI